MILNFKKFIVTNLNVLRLVDKKLYSMTWDDHLFELIKYTIPSLIVFVTAFTMLKKMMEAQQSKGIMDIKQAASQTVLPIRLQSYERLALLLERISIENLIMRVHQNGMTARSFQSQLLQTIRSEFEHNLSQQVYVSIPLWEKIKTAKEETIKIINIASDRLNSDATSIDLSKTIFEVQGQIGQSPANVALQALKKEIRQVF
jgi:hypothetical protein